MVAVCAVIQEVASAGCTINQVRLGELDPKLANCVGYLSGVLLRALEANQLEERISDLEIAIQKPADATGRFDASWSFVPESEEIAQ